MSSNELIIRYLEVESTRHKLAEYSRQLTTWERLLQEENTKIIHVAHSIPSAIDCLKWYIETFAPKKHAATKELIGKVSTDHLCDILSQWPEPEPYLDEIEPIIKERVFAEFMSFPSTPSGAVVE